MSLLNSRRLCRRLWAHLGIYTIISAGASIAQTRISADETQRRLALHERLFTVHDRLSKPLTGIKPDASGVVHFTADFINDYPSVPGNLSPGEQATAELQRMIHASGAVIMARAVGHRSAFTPSKGFIYSDWEFEISRVFKNDTAEAAQLGGIITVTRPGGALVQNGIKYVAEDKTFPDFQDGNVYILFLQSLNDHSHSFRVFSGDCFLVSGNSVSRIDDYQRHSEVTGRLRVISSEALANSLDEMVRAERRK